MEYTVNQKPIVDIIVFLPFETTYAKKKKNAMTQIKEISGQKNAHARSTTSKTNNAEGVFVIMPKLNFI